MSLRKIIWALGIVSVCGNLHEWGYYEAKFFDWLKCHNVSPGSGERFVKMLQNFAYNDDFIATHNSKAGNSFSLGHNQFSHFSPLEWKQYVQQGGFKRVANLTSSPLLHLAPSDPSTLALEVDWVQQGYVTPVKDQGHCGSCWSFSATGALEGAYKKAVGELVSFSEQNFVDCDNLLHGGRDHGCNGGIMDNAFTWVQKNGGICREEDYAYVSGATQTQGTCADSKCPKDPKVAPKSYTDVVINSDEAFMSALNQQPVSVAIEADQTEFQLYKSGVFTSPCGSNLDHGVLAVGYGTLDGIDYYKVKNSWGETWGLGGYILLARGIDQKEGQCGILSGPPSYPNL